MSKFDDAVNSVTSWGQTLINNIHRELRNSIEDAGLVINDSDFEQISKAIANYSAVGTFYTDSGVADVYVLTAISNFKPVQSLINGAKARFRAGNPNTGASTINVAGTGVRDIKLPDGTTNPAATDISSIQDTEIRYDLANDVWILITAVVNPSGMVAAFAFDSPPTGWFECDGAAISRTAFASLFTAIGLRFGIGNGSTTFNLPDLRGEFIRGFDNGAGNDPDAGSRTDSGDGTTGDNVGTKQVDEFKSHVHVDSLYQVQGEAGLQGVDTNNDAHNIDTTATGGNETRPRNVYMMYCIKT